MDAGKFYTLDYERKKTNTLKFMVYKPLRILMPSGI